MRKTGLCIVAAALLGMGLQAQICDQTVQPDSLRATYTPGTGVLLQWNPVPGSEGVGIKALPPAGGSALSKILIGPELSQYLIPEAVLFPGVYRWRVWAACNSTPPFKPSPISDVAEFEIPPADCPATVTDIDGNVYSAVQIGSQCWMAENLKVERYRDGSNIPTGLSDFVWNATTSGAFVVHGDRAVNKAIYGLLYNWYAAVDSRGLCPTGWHVPTDGEWTELVSFLDPSTCGSCPGTSHSSIAGGKMKAAGNLSAGTGLWQAPNTAATNSSGFSGLPGGKRAFFGGYFFLQEDGFWWSSSESSPGLVWTRSLVYDEGSVDRLNNAKADGFSVRCLRD